MNNNISTQEQNSIYSDQNPIFQKPIDASIPNDVNKIPNVVSLKSRIQNIFKMAFVFIKSLFNLTNYKVTHVDLSQVTPELTEKLKKFEASFTYPFSEKESFRIEHGSSGDYFSFFRGLGKVQYYIATCKKDETITKIVKGEKVTITRKAGDIAAVGCGVLREMKTRDGKTTKAWYFCDLKVGEGFRGEHLPLMMIQRAMWRFVQSAKGFGITMNPANGQPRAAEIWKKNAPIKGTQTQTLNLYTLSTEQAINYCDKIKDIFQKEYKDENLHLGYLSTRGQKDYQIFGDDPSKTHEWKLIHLVRKSPFTIPMDAKEFDGYEGSTHMISAVEGTSLDKSLRSGLNMLPSSTAQIVSYGMEKVDFNYLTSNEI